MAKSLRSKTKRSFRSKKREAGVYAATEAARLQRLNAKLINNSLAEKEGDGDVHIEADGDGESSPGWCWFAVFGLLDASDITADALHGMRFRALRRGGSWETVGEHTEAQRLADSSDPIHRLFKWMHDHWRLFCLSQITTTMY
jgi:hypothetical protein